MLKALKNLIVAMINATLILIVLALFLAWKVAERGEQISDNFARALATVRPIRDDIQAATGELAAMRGDLANLAKLSQAEKSADLKRIELRLARMQEQMDDARRSVGELSQLPTRLVDHAIDRSGERLAREIREFRGCVPES